jgi:hypothetical protein
MMLAIASGGCDGCDGCDDGHGGGADPGSPPGIVILSPSAEDRVHGLVVLEWQPGEAMADDIQVFDGERPEAVWSAGATAAGYGSGFSIAFDEVAALRGLGTRRIEVRVLHGGSRSESVWLNLDPPLGAIGGAHAAGKYNFSPTMDYLNEGAHALCDMGTTLIKVFFRAEHYPFNSDWPAVSSLVEYAQTSYFRSLFDLPFDTYVIVSFAPGRPDHYYVNGMSSEQYAAERDDFAELARYLAETYEGTGKTFVLQNWEGDNSLGLTWSGDDPVISKTTSDGMIDWLNARQDGVEQGRAAAGATGVRVLHAFEVNFVEKGQDRPFSCTNDIVPYTHCDLYSYSAYETMLTGDPARLRGALEYLAEKAPDSGPFGSANIAVSEYGVPENEPAYAGQQLSLCSQTITTALDFGARYVIYWQIYCNELTPSAQPPIENNDVRGFWLIRPDGSRCLVYDQIRDLHR